ncbi:hypothetical protein ADU59_27875, partial [Pararhizobium polonicum]
DSIWQEDFAMSHAFSLDLRHRIVDAISRGKSRRAAAADFSVSAATAVRLKPRLDRTGSLEPSRRGRRRDSGKLGPCREAIIAKVEGNQISRCPSWQSGARPIMA